MNLVLDTNAFYHYYGREKMGLSVNPKVNLMRFNTILSNQSNTIAISTITVSEFLVHFRDNPALIKNVLRFIVLRKINIIPFGITNFSIEDIPELIKIPDALIKIRIEKYKKEKIRTEAGFASIFILLLLKIYVNFYFEREERVNPEFKLLTEEERDGRKAEVFGFLLSDDIQGSLKRDISTFTKALRKGYAIGKEEKSVRDTFNNILHLNCAVFSLFLDFFIKNYNIIQFDDRQLKIEYEKLAKQNSDFNIFEKTPNHINKGIIKIIKEFEKEITSGFVEKHRRDVINTWREDNMFSPCQAEYIGRLFLKWIQNGKKYEKNDMLDMMILRTLDIDNCALITFDESMQDYILEIEHTSIEYIKRLYKREWLVKA